MIPAGRTAVDTAGIAELHGLTASQARRARPWAAPDHPPRLTTGTTGTGRPDLWDREQAAAYARGEKFPPLPGGEHPDDLLDRIEAATLIEVTPKTWTDYQVAGKVPPVDHDVCGREHWYRRTVEQYKAEREARAEQPHGGRPPGSAETVPRAQIPARVRALLDRGETNVAEIARQVGIAYSTAHRHVTELTRK